MLAIKIIEGLIRLFGGIGIDRSKRTIDSGLLGALGLLGCFGGRPRRSPGDRSAQAPQQDTKSDISSYSPPLGTGKGTASTPQFLQNESRKGSTNSHPPDVLTPDLANRPYREDCDDEGFIMGAWQPKPSGYIPVSDGPLTSPPADMSTEHPRQQTTSMTSSAAPTTGKGSGFSRVGGGRAHIDSPYAIQGHTGSTHTFPSIGPHSQIFPNGANPSRSTLQPQQATAGYSQTNVANYEEVPLSLMNVESNALPVGANGLPAGAMQPAHIRTKSQTAIVENYHPQPMSAAVLNMASSTTSANRMSTPLAGSSATLMALSSARPKYPSQDLLRPPDSAPSAHTKFMLGPNDEEDDSGDEDHPRRRKWYQLRKPRPHSSEGRPSATPSTSDLPAAVPKVEEEMGGLGSTPTPQRSFVVIRKQPASMGRMGGAALSAESSSTAGAATYPSSSSRPPTR